MQKYINPTDETAIKLFSSGLEGDVYMLNMIKYRDKADYSANPELAPNEAITGEQAYQLYRRHTQPFLAESGGEVIFMGVANDYFIGPADEQWDLVFNEQKKSLKHFIDFATNEAYLKGIGHRTAAVEDSRLLPISNIKK